MDLEQRQTDIEREYTNAGIKDALEHWEKELAAGRMADTGAGRALAARLFSLVRSVLEERLNTRTRGVGAKYLSLVREIGADNCSVIAIRTALAMFGKQRNAHSTTPPEVAQSFISKAGLDAELEHIFIKVQEAAPGYMRRVEESLEEAGTRNGKHRKRTFTASAKNVGLASEDVLWSASEREGVGRVLLESMIKVGVVELTQVAKAGGHNWLVITPSEQIRDHIDSLSNNLRAFTKYPPMLVKPKEHTRETLFNGASYLTPAMAHLCGTVRLRSRRADHRKFIRDNISDTVLRAANKSAQEGYVVDTELVALLRELFATPKKRGLAGVPSLERIMPPVYPLAEGWDRECPLLQEQHAMWKARARQAYVDERERRVQVNTFSQTLKYMQEYSGNTLYFPTYFDWRGRLYFRSRINPQSSDCVKAALAFANKKKLGKRGLFWLKVHVATTYGFDKKLFPLRAAWTDANIEAIKEAVQYHVDSEFFMAADSPWCFYTAAKELLRALASGNPEEFKSGVPVAMDATCSGMQHLSAALRDPVGGMFTNLMPNGGDEKEDIYAGVAGISISNIQKDVDNLVQSKYWCTNGVPRSMAKRPVMTYVYGGTLQSCTEYVYLDMVERNLPEEELYSPFKLSAYLSRHLRNGIESAVPAVAECMRFLRRMAGTMPLDVAITNVSPAGFPMVQHYAQEETIRLNLKGVGVKLVMTRFDDTRMNRSKCVNGIAPNFTHGLDSSHLVLVIVGYNGSIVPIHDSFATHACDVDTMNQVLSDTFVRMYEEHDPIKTLADSISAVTGEEIELPAKGTLDISLVRKSNFFMC